MGEPARPLSEASRELYYDAMEARSNEDQNAMLENALELDPTHVDAWLVLLHDLGLSIRQRIDVLRKLVELAAHQLGPEVFLHLKGSFWGFMETRPYMRARADLAEALRRSGNLEEAAAEWTALLELNPNDNQGLRYYLLPTLLALKRLQQTARLFKQYNEAKLSMVFAWGKVLDLWLRDDFKAAAKAINTARKQNAHVEAYLLGKRLPRILPSFYASGSKEEAVCFADVLGMAWKAHPEALVWLKDK
ncbi:MAG TPA: tetratricopeptide repeat protein [Kiritimatiellia bacterium]|nr:tetratricopeptide repeat protein [Kiritimatiellia bacterium]